MRKFKIISTSLLALVFFQSCNILGKKIPENQIIIGASAKAEKLVENADYQTCKFGKMTRFGQLYLKNNLWGRTKLKEGSDPKLCSYKRGNDFVWKWELPDNASGVIGYPALQVGRNPFEKHPTDDSGFPIKLSKLKSLTVKYDVETFIEGGRYNLAFDLWLTDIYEYGLDNIQTEIMVWEDYLDFTTYGKKMETIITPFGAYEIFEGYLNNPNFKQDWQYIALIRTGTRTKGKVDLGYLINYLVEKEYINKDYYLTSMEFGNEILSSNGTTLVKQFNWRLRQW